jgi:hypothetical protein
MFLFSSNIHGSVAIVIRLYVYNVQVESIRLNYHKNKPYNWRTRLNSIGRSCGGVS